MKGLYLLLDGLTLLFPILLSFDRRVHFFSKWKSVFISSLIVAVPFVIWDIIFTENRIWGFNDEYLIGITFYNLPIEELLFFFVVPFACSFIYECCKYYFRAHSFKLLNRCLFYIIPLYGMLLSLIEPPGWYTLSVIFSSSIVLFFWLRKAHFKMIGITFIISLIPFLVVNGILTGGITPNPVVWYNEAQKVGPRIWTIPMEDILYSFTLIVSILLGSEYFEERRLR